MPRRYLYFRSTLVGATTTLYLIFCKKVVTTLKYDGGNSFQMISRIKYRFFMLLKNKIRQDHDYLLNREAKVHSILSVIFQ